jgi:hypothetical protein
VDVKKEVATVDDKPAQPVRVVKQFEVEVGVCPRCGWRDVERVRWRFKRCRGRCVLWDCGGVLHESRRVWEGGDPMKKQPINP